MCSLRAMTSPATQRLRTTSFWRTPMPRVYRRIYANFKIVAIGERTVSNGEFVPANRIWAGASQVSEVAYWPEEVRHSNDNGPEHEIVYVNESIANESAPTYWDMSMFGMSVRSTGRLVDVSQLRYWMGGWSVIALIRTHSSLTTRLMTLAAATCSLTWSGIC